MTSTNRRSILASLRGADVKRPRRLAPYVLLAVVATLIAIASHESNYLWWRRFDNIALDQGFGIRGPVDPKVVPDLPQTRGMVIVQLSYTIPRPVLATLVHKLRYARVVAIDLMLPDQESELHPIDRESPVWQEQIRKWRIENAGLAASIKKANNVILGVWPELLPIGEDAHVEAAPPGAQNRIVVSSSSGEDRKIEWRRPPEVLWKAARWHAHLRVEPDIHDGIVRRVRLHEMTPFSSTPLPAFSLAAAKARGGVQPENITYGGEDGTVINYLGGPKTFSSDRSTIVEPVAINEADAEDFRDMTVFVGHSNFSSKDVFPTPYGDVPGVEIHAQAAATWVTPNGGLKPVAPAWTILISLLCSMLLLAPLARWPFWSTSISGVFLVLGIVIGCMAGHAWGGISIPMSVPLFAVALTYNGAALVELRRARATLGRFIGQDLVAQTLHPLSSLELGGRTEVATAFFCDLRGYSRLSETISPDRAANLLKAYTTTLTRVVESHGGRPIDYLGDGVFVLFEERHTKGAHALAAAQAAVEAQRAFAALDEQWSELVAPQGQPLEAAIAIHTGEMLIGLVGDEKHLKPGAVGDAVNVAAHAQSYSQECGHRILATREAVAAIGGGSAGFAVHPCGEFKFKGRQNLVELFGIESLERSDTPVDAVGIEA